MNKTLNLVTVHKAQPAKNRPAAHPANASARGPQRNAAHDPRAWRAPRTQAAAWAWAGKASPRLGSFWPV